MSVVIVAPRQSLGKMYARYRSVAHPIVVTPRAPDVVRGHAGVTEVVILGIMIDSPKLRDLFAVIRPACAPMVTLSTSATISRTQARALEAAWMAAPLPEV